MDALLPLAKRKKRENKDLNAPDLKKKKNYGKEKEIRIEIYRKKNGREWNTVDGEENDVFGLRSWREKKNDGPQ